MGYRVLDRGDIPFDSIAERLAYPVLSNHFPFAQQLLESLCHECDTSLRYFTPYPAPFRNQRFALLRHILQLALPDPSEGIVPFHLPDSLGEFQV